MDAKRSKWWISRVLLGAVVLVLIYGARRFQLIRVPPGFDGLTPSYPTGGGTLMVDRYHTHARGLGRMDILLYEGRIAGQPQQLVARVRALPGDQLGRKGSRLTIRGRVTAFEARKLPGGKVPEGYYLLLNENERSGIPDGRVLGLIPREQILGRVIAMFPESGPETPTR